MWPSGTPGGTDTADNPATGQALTDLHVNLRHVAEHADKALAMVDEYGFAIEKVIADQDHLAGSRRLDRGAGGDGEVQASVGVALFPIEEATYAEAAGKRAAHGFVQQQVAWRARAEAAVRRQLLGQFTLEAFQVRRVWVDLALIFQGDALFRVSFATHREVQGAAGRGELRRPRLEG
ncbi:hypothetical protein D3C80_781210 [compost metagenome]